MKKFLALALAAAMSLSLVACGGGNTSSPAASSKPAASGSDVSTPAPAGNGDFKVGAIYITSQNDVAGYTFQHHNGITTAMKDLGMDPAKQLLIVDNVAEDYDAVCSAIDTLANQGADIIYAAASNSGDGVSEAAVELGRYVIGVDTDKSFQGPENVMGSMLKNVTKSFYDVIAAKNNGETLDAEQRCGLSKKWVEMYFIDSMAQFLPEEVMTAIAQAEERIVSGSVTVQEAAN